MDHSPFFNAIRTGKWPRVEPVLVIAGHVLKRFYFLVHGIYLRYPIFALPPSDGHSRKKRMYSARHSSVRKAFERLFGMLFKQFRVMYLPCLLWHLKDMHYVLKAFAILHNMIASRRGHAGRMKFREELDSVDAQCQEMMLQHISSSMCRYEQAAI